VSSRLVNTQTRVVIQTSENNTIVLRVFAPDFASPAQINLAVPQLPSLANLSQIAVSVAQYQCEQPNVTSTCSLVDVSPPVNIALTP
jgi:hypothetical protein